MSPAEQNKPLRRSAAEMPSITGLRLSPHGAEASLVNISTTGVLAECTVRMKVGTAVTVLFEGAFSPSSVAGHVARCEVAAMGRDGVLRYHVAIVFNVPIGLEAEASAAPQGLQGAHPPPPPAPVPIASAARNRW